MAERQTEKPRIRRRRLLLVGLVVAALAAVGSIGVTSLALFTDQEQVTGNAFTTATLDLTVDTPTALVTYTSPAMTPGDQDTAPLVVGNSGSIELRYAMTSTTTEDTLAGELVLTIKTGVTTCDNANWTTDGTQIYQGALGTIAGIAALGDNTSGAQAGDRTLAAAATETLCFNVTLPLSATNAAQGLTTTATFTFDGEQTANNP